MSRSLVSPQWGVWALGVLLAAAVIVGGSGCGKKGPPLPPLSPEQAKQEQQKKQEQK